MTPPPYWALLLEIAQHDPLRAQELEEGLSQEWWERYQEYARAQKKAKAAQQDNK